MSVSKPLWLICILAISLLFASLRLVAQQQPQLAHYMFNPQFNNPGSVGFSNSINASVVHRQQWYGFEGAPQTTFVSFDAPIRVISSGVGLNIINDQIGLYKNTTIQLQYNYQLPVLDGVLGLGIQGGMNSMGLKITDPKVETSEDPTLKAKEDASKFLFDGNIGLFYQVVDRYEVGLSMDLNQPQAREELGYRKRRNLNLFGNYHFTIERFPEIDFVPSTIIRSDFSGLQMDVSLVGMYQKQYWGGVSYRLGDAAALIGGLFIKQFQVGLAYELATSRMMSASKIGGSFELFFRYCFNLSIDRLPQSYKNSRYL